MDERVAPKKSLGQNFLTDPNTARKIADALRAGSGDHVVEIGPGTGALTGILAERYPVFTAIEIDRRAVALLQEKHPSLDVRCMDVLHVDWDSLAEKGSPIHVIGNLPYYITSQILFSLLDYRAVLKEAILMMQLEVAERLVAAPRSKAYGILSVAVQLEAVPELLFRVSRNVFFPKPDVTSAVVRLTFGSRQDYPADVDRNLVRQVVREAFNQRRKTLRNSLSSWTRDQGIDLPEGWSQRRAEEFTPEDFIELARHLGRHGR
jgi:16S rRNA (adenine1518-N6/adenine1519-N6)-dimethyltransferase